MSLSAPLRIRLQLLGTIVLFLAIAAATALGVELAAEIIEPVRAEVQEFTGEPDPLAGTYSGPADILRVDTSGSDYVLRTDQ